jgi:hypothetical protein
MNLNSWSAINLYITFDKLPMCWKQFAETEANQGSLEPEEVSDLEADVEAACEWLDIDDDDSPEASKDILKIVKSCLKGMKRLKTGRSIKMMIQLTAIAEYVKLRTRFQAHSTCKRPCLNASLAIA